jgi:integrase
LIGLRWNDLIYDSAESAYKINVDERFCRGDWDQPKSAASETAIWVDNCVVERINRLRLLTVEVRAGNAVRKYKVVKTDGPTDLVFQSVRDGKPMRDNNILTRFIKPAGLKLGMDFVNWLVLRRSHDYWLDLLEADLKVRQAQMRHAHPRITADIYDQFNSKKQLRVVSRLHTLAVAQL